MQVLTQILAIHATHRSDQPAFTFVKETGDKECMTFAALDQQSEQLAYALASRCQPGDRVVILLPQDNDYIRVFMACLKAGVIAVPLYPPRLNQYADRVEKVVLDCQPSLIVTSSALVCSLSLAFNECQVVDMNSLSQSLISNQEHSSRTVQSEDIAFLQYTSGSTGVPKGVMVTQGNIVANLDALIEATQTNQQDIFCNWLPLFHDLGLIITMLLPVYVGAHSIIMTPTHFIRRPLKWLEIIDDYRGTIAGCPNFAFEYCVEKLSAEQISHLDLSSWRIAFNAAEPIKPKTLIDFSQRFSAQGFRQEAIYPSYGMAEATVFIAAGSAGAAYIQSDFSLAALGQGRGEFLCESNDQTEDNTSQLIGCGQVQSGHDLLILDPETNNPVAEGIVGQICVAGPSVALGYWNDKEKTATTFNFMVPGHFMVPGNALGFLKTGDLGFIKSGILYITGRIKDVMIVNGRNLYPQDFEALIYQHFSFIRNNGLAAFEHEGLCYIVLEVKRDQQQTLNYQQAVTEICACIYRDYDVLLADVIFIKSGTLNKTSSGKVQRTKIKNRYLAQKITVISSLQQLRDQQQDQTLPVTALEQALCTIWCAALSLKSIGIHQNLYSLGGQSITAIKIVHAIQETLTLSISLAEILQYPTIAELAIHLEQSPQNKQKIPISGLNHAPLTPLQKSLFFTGEKRRHADHNLTLAYDIQGLIQPTLLEQAFIQLIKRHPALRTYLQQSAQDIEQKIQEIITFNLEEQWFSVDQHHDVEQAIELMATHEFNLFVEIPLRVQLISLENNQSLLLMTLHHLFADGWSGGILIDELSVLYNNLLQNIPTELPALTHTHIDYCHYLKQQSQALFNQHLTHRLEQLADHHSSQRLPFCHPEVIRKDLHCDSVTMPLNGVLQQQIEQIVQTNKVSPFTLFNAALAVLLYQYTQQKTVVWALPAANREQAAIQDVVGCFVNTLVATHSLTAEHRLGQILTEVQTELLAVLNAQSVPFDTLVQALLDHRPLDHNPLAQVMIVEEKMPLPHFSGAILKARAVPLISEFDLTLRYCHSSTGESVIHWQYHRALFSEVGIQRFIDSFKHIIQGFATQPNCLLSQFMRLTPMDEQRLNIWQNTDYLLPEQPVVLHEFTQQVQQRPQQIALRYAETEMTYQALDNVSNQLAHLLQQKTVVPGTVVAICLERSIAMVVAIYAIMKTGSAYLPLDSTLPHHRIQTMLDDAAVQHIISDEALIKQHHFTSGTIISLDSKTIKEQLENSPINALVSTKQIQKNDLAYVMYTSGSTGTPKGVMIEHQGLYNRLHWMQRAYPLTTVDRVLQKTPYSFDVSVWELIWPLLQGATLVIAQPEQHKNPEALHQLITKEQISVIHFVPSMLNMMLTTRQWGYFSRLRYIFCSGEALPMALAQTVLTQSPQSQLINLYGPTEASIDVTHFVCEQLERYHRVPIGQGIQNTKLYVLNEQLQQVPIGVKGELYISGIGVAQGYINQAKQTAERFIKNPFYQPGEPQYYQRLYKTGDITYWVNSGELHYVGRCDSQIKLRGQRIELGEIEAQLMQFQEIAECVVMVQTLHNEPTLVAYYRQTTNDLSRKKIQQHLTHYLPTYMVPTFLVPLTQFPLSVNGKIDRQQLPIPVVDHQSTEYAAPKGKVEQQLAELWQQILHVERVGREDNFFHLGGHSMHLMQLMSAAKNEGIQLSISNLYDSLTLADLAATASLVSLTAVAEPENLFVLSAEDDKALREQIASYTDNIQDSYPLAPLQQGIFYHYLLVEKHDPYVTEIELHVANMQQLQRFIAGLNFLIMRHDILRTAVVWEGMSQPQQVVYRTVELPCHQWVIDEESDLDAAFFQLQAQIQPTIDISQAPCLHLHYAKRSPSDDVVVIVQLHHIIDDALSLLTGLNELVSYLKNEQKTLPPAIPYRNFVVQNNQINEQQVIHFFTKQLAGIDESTFPFGLDNTRGDGQNIIEFKHRLPESLSTEIHEIAKYYQVSAATFFHSVWALVVAACSGQDDIVFGTVLSGRLAQAPHQGSMLGVMINTLPLRINLFGLSSVDLLRHVQQQLKQLLPIELAPLSLAHQATETSQPLFSALLNYRHSIDIDQISAPLQAVVGTSIRHYKERTNYPFVLSVSEFTETFELNLQLNAAIEIMSVRDYLLTTISSLLDALRQTPTTRALALSVLPQHEIETQIYHWNQVQDQGSLAITATQLLTEQAALRPLQWAVIEGEQQLNYADLEQKTTELAYFLCTQGVKRGDFVGVCMARSTNTIISLLAVMKAGAAYVAIDPNYPASRQKFIIIDANLQFVLVEKTTHLNEQEFNCQLIEVESSLLTAAAVNTDILIDHAPNADDPAYVIYTSGTTGQPKGVVLGHRGLTNLCYNLKQAYRITAKDTVLQFASLSFDMSVEEIFGALTQGATLVLRNEACLYSADEFWVFCERHAITIANLPPAFAQQMFTEASPCSTALRVVSVGGDKLPIPFVEQWFARTDHMPELFNAYGPSECTVNATISRVTPGYQGEIGRGIANSTLYVMNEGRLLPMGVVGELYVGGACVAHGYHQQPELNNQQFIEHSLAPQGEKLYRTGDRVRWLPNGQLQYLGRCDHQVKIRGFRIELGEIEQAINNLNVVEQAVVIQDPQQPDRLIAYIVQQPDHPFCLETQSDLLSQQLPDHMMPSLFIPLERLPLTRHGKIDRKQLPAPNESLQQRELIAPKNMIETRLLSIWQELLGIEKISTTDHFYRLGGHSLLITRLSLLINKTFDIEIPLSALITVINIQKLAELIEVEQTLNHAIQQHTKTQTEIKTGSTWTL